MSRTDIDALYVLNTVHCFEEGVLYESFLVEIQKFIQSKCLIGIPKVVVMYPSKVYLPKGHKRAQTAKISMLLICILMAMRHIKTQPRTQDQDEPLAVAGQEYALNFEEDKDGIPAETLEARYTKVIPVGHW